MSPWDNAVIIYIDYLEMEININCMYYTSALTIKSQTYRKTTLKKKVLIH